MLEKNRPTPSRKCPSRYPDTEYCYFAGRDCDKSQYGECSVYLQDVRPRGDDSVRAVIAGLPEKSTPKKYSRPRMH